MDFEIGKIVNTHGLKGDLKVYPTTDDPSRFSLLKQVWVSQGDRAQQYIIQYVKHQQKLLIVKFEQIDTVNQAQLLKGALIKIPNEMALPLQEDEYYIRDLYGIKVYENGKYLGEIKDVIQTGANDVYVVGDKLLIPAIKSCIVKVDIAAATMDVKLPKGLL
ncbi:MAG: ribosome maturation factor RimM [Defluviitaleaceae bacterium]|nr:ribosome maturation factor RimM [Defluviitaleaceae bacterium]